MASQWTIEAENIATISGYRRESLNVASGGAVLSFVGGASGETGTATFTFTGTPGTYNLVLGAFDENDGAATLKVTKNGSLLGSVLLNQNLGSNAATAATKVEKTVATGVSIVAGDSFTITGLENSAEHARFDFIRFEPTGAPPPVVNKQVTVGTTQNGAEPSTNGLFTVNLSQASTTNTVVAYSVGGTATAGSDYSALSGTVTIPAGQLAATIPVTVINDSASESNETVIVTLTGVTGAADVVLGTTKSATLSIADNDGTTTPSALTIEAETIATISGYRRESLNVASGGAVLSFVGGASGETGTATFTFTGTPGTYNLVLGAFDENDGAATLKVTKNGSLLGSVLLNQNLGSNAATAATKVEKTVATGVSIVAGDSFTITGLENSAEHARFDFIRFEPTGAPPPVVNKQVTVGTTQNGAEPSTNGLFTVNLSQASSTNTVVAYSVGGTATAGSDYTSLSGSVTIPSGQLSATIPVAVINDSTPESSETVIMTLTGVTGAADVVLGATKSATLSIADNDGTTPPRFNYGEALQKTFLFYEAQRSGDLPASNRIEWRGDSALADGSDVGRNLSGGYYDAGDLMKYNFPMAYAMTMLSWGVREYRSGYSSIGQLDEALAAIRWGTDYLLKCHVADASGTKEFWAQVGKTSTDHGLWGPPETMTMARPSYKIDAQHPGSDLAAEAAAAFAAASIIFRPTDSTYANTLLTNAKQLYTFADTYRGKFSDGFGDPDLPYKSYNGYQDELSWGAIWVHEAIQAAGQTDTAFLAKAETYFPGIVGFTTTQSYDSKHLGAGILLAQDTGKSTYRTEVEKSLNYWLPGGGVAYTSGGLAWITDWGSLRYAANTAFLAGIYADTITDPQGKYNQFAATQIDYILGANPRNSSYMVGFGNTSTRNPHHRGASGKVGWDAYFDGTPNQHLLYGALTGGPMEPNDFAYQDVRTDYVGNEVSIEYSAGLTGALARAVDIFGGTPLTDTQLDSLPGIVVPSY